MLEVVFDRLSESGLQEARYIGSCVLLNKEIDAFWLDIPSEEDKEIIKKNALFILGNNDFKCVRYEYGLDTGDLNIPLSAIKRKSYVIDTLMRANYYEYDEETGKYYCNAIEEITKAVNNHESIRIWLSNDTHSMCGFYDLCSRLKDYDGLILVVQAPQEPINRSCWGGIKNSDRYKYSDREYRITKEKMYEIAKKWDILKEENSNLRLLIDGELKSVEDDYFDYIIFNAFNIASDDSEGIIQQKIIGITMRLGVDSSLILYDSIIALRIDSLIASGKIEIVEDNAEKYRRVIKKYESKIYWKE